MALLPILQFPDPQLRLKALAVESVDDKIISFTQDLLATMYENNGVGLAATQVNVQKRIFVMDCSRNKSEPMVLINPEIIVKEGEIIWEEGCLSFPGIYAKVKRASKITVKYLDQHGKSMEQSLSELRAVCVQHEIDHLDGKLFFDHLSALKQGLVWDQINKNRSKRL